jgi:DNA-binding MarR family transcriptional regulator
MDKQQITERAGQLISAMRKLKQMKLVKADKSGLRNSEIHFMLMLATVNDGRPVTPSEAAKELNVTLAAVTHHINSLEEQGLVSRLSSPEDRRVSLISLSDKGAKLVEDLRKKRWKKMCDLVEHLGDNESAELISLFDKISEYFEKAEH